MAINRYRPAAGGCSRRYLDDHLAAIGHQRRGDHEIGGGAVAGEPTAGSSRQIGHLVRDDPANTPGGVGRVALPAGNQVYVGMKDGLAGRGPAVHTDVESGDGTVGCLKLAAKDADQFDGIAHLFGRHFEPVGCMPFGNDEMVSPGHCKAVFDRPDGSQLRNDPFSKLLRAKAAAAVGSRCFSVRFGADIIVHGLLHACKIEEARAPVAGSPAID